MHNWRIHAEEETGAVRDSCMDMSRTNEHNLWSTPVRCSKPDSNVPGDRFNSVAASYVRGPERSPEWQQDNVWRIVLHGGWYDDGSQDQFPNSTWMYYPPLNSWTLVQSPSQPSGRLFHSMNTLCKTRVILFGGNYHYGPLSDTWLFSGVTELWQELDVNVLTLGEFASPSPRGEHDAVVIQQPLSNCTCQESIVIYGGFTNKSGCFGDLWEMRCVADRNGTEIFYWISLQDNRQSSQNYPPVRRYHHSAAFNKTVLYTWGGWKCTDTYPYQSDQFSTNIWEYNLTSRSWRLPKANNMILWYSPPHWDTTIHNSVFFEDGIVTVTANATLVLKSINGSLFLKTVPTSIPKDLHLGFPIPSGLVVVGEALYSWRFSRSSFMSLWKLNKRTSFDWYWYSVETPVASPGPLDVKLGKDFVTSVGQSFLIVSDSTYVNQTIGTEGVTVWQFDLSRLSWFLTWSPFGPRPFCFGGTFSAIGNSLLIVYYPHPCPPLPVLAGRDFEVRSTSLWVFHSSIRRWTLCLEEADQHQLPEPRFSSTIVEMSNGSLLLFGGETSTGVLNDLWRVELCDQAEYMPVREDCVRWVLLNGNSSRSTSPGPRHSHLAFVFHNILYIFGGTYKQTLFERGLLSTSGLRADVGVTDDLELASYVFSDMWKFNTTIGAWEEEITDGKTPILPCSIAKWGTKAIAVGRRTYPYDTCKTQDTYVFDINDAIWSKLADSPLETMVIETRTMALVYFRRRFVILRQYYQIWPAYAFSFVYPACPAGHFTSTWNNGSCAKCPKGSYAAISAKVCTWCPRGLTTETSSSHSLDDCKCRSHYCVQGQCNVVVLDGEQKAAHCDCMAGYTGTTCKYPTYYLICASIVGVMILAFSLVLFVRRMVKYKKGKKDVELELHSAHKVWTIYSSEVKLEGRIDGETPGSYGEVYRAIYRDMTVAVKYLKAIMFTDPTIRREFEREVEVMRGIRHPNIVMFFGAGKQTGKHEDRADNPYPFLVVEFMARGTLKKILDCTDFSITHKERVSFALDAARGMQYLHDLSPPRIHRDLKSSNLLVSRSWVVKVSDFGSARLVKTEGERQQTGVAISPRDTDHDETPVLRADFLMTRDTGTVLWRAPEIFALERYGTSADVYR